jgi:hypothetical protein
MTIVSSRAIDDPMTMRGEDVGCFALRNQNPFHMRILTPAAALLLGGAVHAQQTITVSTAAGNAQQTYYSLQNGVVGSHALAAWDLAFELTGITGSIRVNTAKGIRVYKAPFTIAQWDQLDTTGLASAWPQQHNSETDWSSGALNQGLTSNPFDLGWGIYNMATHNVIGDSCFVLKLADGTWRKLRIDNYLSATNAFNFTWANLDGSGQQSASLVRSDFPGKNFGYFSFASGTTLDLEPPSAEWDLLFTKYMAFVPFPQPSMYPVAGVLQNRNREARRVNGVTPAYSDWSSGPFTLAINTIGYDWKTFNQAAMQWEYATDRVHFVKDAAGNVYRLVFTAYGGSATGEMTFEQTLMSSTGMEEQQRAQAVVFPNPVVGGQAWLQLELPAGGATVIMADAAGRELAAHALAGSGPVLQPIDVGGWAPGLYVVRVQAGGGILATARFIIP